MDRSQAIKATELREPAHRKGPNRFAPKRSISVASAPSNGSQAAGWDIVLDAARRQLHHFVNLEPKVLQGEDFRAIHDFRVASRRLQQVLDLLNPKTRPKKIRKLRRTIRRSRRIFSTLRNCDVLIERVKMNGWEKRAGRREGWEVFHDYLQKCRSAAFQEAVGKLIKLNLSDFYVQLQRILNALPQPLNALSGAATDGLQARGEAESRNFQDRVSRELRVLWETFGDRVATSQKERVSGSLHAVRIAGKRLRYLIEVISELGAPQSKNILNRLRRVQQHLGDWHDLEVMEQMMAEMLARPAFLRSNIDLAMKIERLMLSNQRLKQNYEKKYYATIDSPDWHEMRAWVVSLVSQSQPGAPVA